MIYKAKITLCSEMHTKICKYKVITMQNFWMLNLVVLQVTGKL
jgi:hypothetical protein